jgi:hypothetical protein
MKRTAGTKIELFKSIFIKSYLLAVFDTIPQYLGHFLAELLALIAYTT